MKYLILIIALTSTAFALTPKERELVQGLTKINADLREQVSANEATIAKDASAYAELLATNAAQAEKLDKAMQSAKQQETDLSAQQIKIHEQAAQLAQTEKDRDAFKAEAAKYKLEAHRNAVQRDIACGIFAIAGTILIMTCSGQIIGAIVKFMPFFAPYGILLEIGLTVFFLNLLFWSGEGFLAVIYLHL